MKRSALLLVVLLFISILLLAAVNQSIAQPPQRDDRPRTASISGRVTIDGKAATNVKIVITAGKEDFSPRNKNVAEDIDVQGALGWLAANQDYSALTDADGRYRVNGLPKDIYLVRPMSGSFVRDKQSPKPSLVEAVSIDEGESREDVDFALVRGGVITGRLTDANGRPLIESGVELQVVNEQGKKVESFHESNTQDLMMNISMFNTDDRGVYRIFGLPAGRYLVSVRGRTSRTWHPDATDEDHAKIIEVTAGGEVTGVDIKVDPANEKKTYQAFGRVVDSETGRPVAGAFVACQGFKTADGIALGLDTGRTDEHGNFRFKSLLPAEYYLKLGYEWSTTGGGGNYYSAVSKIEIQEADVEGIEIRAKIGATISGVAVIEGGDPSEISKLSQTFIMTNYARTSRSGADFLSSLVSENGSPDSRIGNDGGFIIKGLRPGTVLIGALDTPDDALKFLRVERGGVDVSAGITVREREEIKDVRIVYGKASCVIRGQAQVIGGELPEGWLMRVRVVEEERADWGDFFGSKVEVNKKGQFTIERLLPGVYELTLVLAPPPGLDPASPNQPRPPAPIKQKITVAKGKDTQVTMTLDLSKKDQEEK